jgi:hypothetical protein
MLAKVNYGKGCRHVSACTETERKAVHHISPTVLAFCKRGAISQLSGKSAALTVTVGTHIRQVPRSAPC